MGKNGSASYDWYRHNDLPREAHEVHPGGPSMTRQEFAAECDINNIMQQYERHLADPTRSIREPVYYDFAALPQTLMECMSVFHAGEAAFMTLPASVRKEFDNDPAMFVDFASDPANLDQMREWQLAPPVKLPDPPMRVEVVQAAPAPGGAPALAGAPSQPPKGG